MSIIAQLFILNRVDSIQKVKVSDGSFSYDLYPQEYMFDKLKDQHIPVSWMVPESLQSGLYDTMSDVVSIENTVCKNSFIF